jgi:hypothetical protein
MRKYVWFLCFSTLLSSVVSAQSLSERYLPLGTVLVPQLPSAPFPHPARTVGHTYGKKTFPYDPHYTDSSVALFLPAGFVPADSINFVIYFHGWYNSIDSACAQFSLFDQFSESEKNAVFVFPEGPKYAPDSFGGRMEEKDGLKRLVSDVLTVLQKKNLVATRNVGKIILAGHSGAFRVMAYCIARGGLTPHISDVILFDALYAQTEKYAHWIEHGNGRFINIYTDDGGTKNESINLMEDLDAWGIPYFASPESLATTDHLRQHRLIFLHSGLGHNDVIAGRRQLRDFLMTSTLPPIR